MTPSPTTGVVLDACVLYPAPLRDLLLQLGSFKLYRPYWTQTIREEWQRSLRRNRFDLLAGQLERTAKLMDSVFPDMCIEGHEHLIPALDLPDADDRHVLAAAMRHRVNVIVTFNLKDFPGNYLAELNVKAQHPDDFITELINSNPKQSLAAFKKQVSNLKNPPKTAQEVLAFLMKTGVPKTSEAFRRLL
jgi:hypothetical protein